MNRAKRHLRLVLGLALALCLPLCAHAAPAEERGLERNQIKDVSGQTVGSYGESYALLIGVSKYTAGWPSLVTVPAELDRVAAALKTQGFKTVVRVANPTGKEIKAAFEDFKDKYGYTKNNRLLVYFSGHGYTLDGGETGYLVPADAPNPEKDEENFRRIALDMNRILAISREMSANHALFLFDSCFSGAIFKQRDLPKQPPIISTLTAQPVRQFITAGDAGESVPASSTFTAMFVDAMEHGIADLNKDGYTTGTELGSFLQSDVPKRTRQTPQYGKISDYKLSRGDFVFLSANSSADAIKPLFTTSPTQLAIPTFRDKLRDGGVGPEMVAIPAGIFDMGSLPGETGREANEGPQHRVTLAKGFALGKHEITVGEFRRFATATHYSTDAERNFGFGKGCNTYSAKDNKFDWRAGASWKNPEYPQTEDHPVVCVSLNDVEKYAAWLNEQTGKHYRVPGEAEWEYAARAGATTARYWGDDASDACRYANVADETKNPDSGQARSAKHDCNDGNWYSAPVGSYVENKFGLKDMLGNVWEWTGDCWHETYRGAPADGTIWKTGDCGRRVARGAAWSDTPTWVRSATRIGYGPAYRSGDHGFRLAQDFE